MIQIPTVKIDELIDHDEATIQTGPFGTQLKASDYVPEGTPVINVRNVGFGEIRDASLEYIDDVKKEKLASHILQKGDIVFGRKGAVERHAFIDKTSDGWVQGSDCLRLRVNSERFNNRFLSYYFRTPSHQNWMMAVCAFGATMASLNQDIVKRIEIPLIDKPIQDKITAVLSAYDDLIENNKRRIALLEKAAEELYKEWFVRMRFPGHEAAKFEKGIPEGWEVKKIGDVFEIKRGKVISSKDLEDGTVPVIGGGLSSSGFHNKSNTTAPVITISASGANAGFVNIWYQDVWASDCSVIDMNITESVYYAYLILKTRQFEVTNLQKGSAQPHVYAKDVMDLGLIAPTSTLVERFEKIVNPVFDNIKNLQAKNENLKTTRDRLLTRLISGKLSVEDLDTKFPKGMEG